MSRRKLCLSAMAFVAALMAVLLLLYFRPLSDTFKSVFGKENGEIPTVVDVGIVERDKVSFAALFPDAEKTVRSFFTLFYSDIGASGTSYGTELEKLYSPLCSDLLYDRLALFAANERREKSPSALDFSSCMLSLRYNSLQEASDTIIVLTAEVQADLPYTCLSGAAAESGITSHTLTLKNGGTGWVISAHSAEGGVWSYANGVFERVYGADGFSRSELTYTYLKPYYEKACELVKIETDRTLAQLADKTPPEAAAAEYAYNRAAAVEYAKKWARGGYELRDKSYGVYSDDSANFVSQCLFAGGIPMDCEGDDGFTQWKYYGGEPNPLREAAGCSASWYDCEAFYGYCAQNSGFGLVCAVSEALGSAERGDVIQLLGDGAAVSEVIVTEVLYENGKACDLLVSGHSPDSAAVPLSSVCVTELRLLKIVGFNTADF